MCIVSCHCVSCIVSNVEMKSALLLDTYVHYNISTVLYVSGNWHLCFKFNNYSSARGKAFVMSHSKLPQEKNATLLLFQYTVLNYSRNCCLRYKFTDHSHTCKTLLEYRTWSINHAIEKKSQHCCFLMYLLYHSGKGHLCFKSLQKIY